MKYIKLFLLVSLAFMFITPAYAVEAVTSFTGGFIAKEGSRSEFMYSVGLDLPAISKKSAGYTMLLKTEIMYSDFAYNEVKEIQGFKTIAINQKKFGWSPIHLGLGAGFWFLSNADGEDEKVGVFSLSLGIELWGMQIDTGLEMVPIKSTSDIYYPFLSVSIISW